jgi:tetraacyldisaccharide 4'-kinase
MTQRLVRAPLAPLAAVYAAAARAHRALYARGFRPRAQLPARVISVGNVTVGGSGKTPTAGWLAAELHARGHRVALLCRGVGGARMREVNVVSDGSTLRMAPEEVGDEPVWLATTTPGVPVLAGLNRLALGLRAVAAFSADILVLDDGFQHHRLARDLDLVCIDATLGLGNRWTLPRGPLREPWTALRRADALIFTRVPRGSAPAGGASTREPLSLPLGLPAPLRRPPSRDDGERAQASQAEPMHPEWHRQRVLLRGLALPELTLAIEPTTLRRLGTGEHLPLDALRGRSVGVLAAVARPQQVVATIERLGGHVTCVRASPDHHIYTQDEIESLDPAIPWITTAKDAVKIRDEWGAGRAIHVIVETVSPLVPSDPLPWIIDRLALHDIDTRP